MEIPYQRSDDSLTIILGGSPRTIQRSHTNYDRVVATMADDNGTEAELEALLNPAKAIFEAVNDDDVTIVGNSVRYKGENIPSDLNRKILAIVHDGLDPLPWRRFLVRLFRNPSAGSRAELGQFLEGANLPLTPDGCFLAYKRVRADYTDCHSGTFDNTPGNVVSLPGERADVDPDRDRHCSYGLHFCSQEYLKSFWGERVVIVKIDPADVVSIPSDYSFTKGRTWKYEVMGEIDLSTAEAKAEWGVIDTTYDYGDEDDWDDDVFPEDEVVAAEPEGEFDSLDGEVEAVEAYANVSTPLTNASGPNPAPASDDDDIIDALDKAWNEEADAENHDRNVDLSTLRLLVQAEGITRRRDYRKARKNRPAWPASPERLTGWVSYKDLFGTA